jgi:hypothetical protein
LPAGRALDAVQARGPPSVPAAAPATVLVAGDCRGLLVTGVQHHGRSGDVAGVAVFGVLVRAPAAVNPDCRRALTHAQSDVQRMCHMDQTQA